MFSSSSSQSNLHDLLKDPKTSLDDVLSSQYFLHCWKKHDSHLFSFIIDHYDEFINIGFQIKSESINSIRCLQIMSSTNKTFRHDLFTKTKFLQFVHDYIFNIASYPYYSQKNYFYVLPNLMLDKFDMLNSIFDQNYFTELFYHLENDFAFTFILRLIDYGPISISKTLNEIKLDELVVSNMITYNSMNNQDPTSKLILVRSYILFKELVSSKFEGNLESILHDKIDDIIDVAIKNPNAECFSFLRYVDELSTSKSDLSKWHKIHLKIIPHLSSIIEIVLNSRTKQFNSLYESCTLLSISITLTTKEVPVTFIYLFRYLLSLFFVLKTNSFLHNCFLQTFKTLVSLDKVDSAFLDENKLFAKVTESYENREKDGFCTYWGQLRKISKKMDKFTKNSKTVDLEKWKKFVIETNKESEKVLNSKYGEHLPPDFNNIRRKIFKHKYYNPCFCTKNLYVSNKHKQKVVILTSPLS